MLIFHFFPAHVYLRWPLKAYANVIFIPNLCNKVNLFTILEVFISKRI